MSKDKKVTCFHPRAKNKCERPIDKSVWLGRLPHSSCNMLNYFEIKQRKGVPYIHKAHVSTKEPSLCIVQVAVESLNLNPKDCSSQPYKTIRHIISTHTQTHTVSLFS